MRAAGPTLGRWLGPRFLVGWLGAGLALTGCGVGQAPVRDVTRLVEERGGPAVSWRKPGAPMAREARELLARPLTAETAARVAVLNQPELQAEFERLGVSSAALLQARPRNPSLHVEYVMADEPHWDLSLVQELTSLALLPSRRGVAHDELTATQHEVAGAALSVAHQARVELFAYQRELGVMARRETALEAADAAWVAADALHEAGNLTDLALLREATALERARLGALEARERLLAQRERVALALGLRGDEPWSAAPELPALPEAPTLPADAEARALRASLALSALRLRLEAQALRAGLAGIEGWLPSLGAGITAQHERGEWHFGPVVELEVPLFSLGGGAQAAAEAELRGLAQRYLATGLATRSATRAARTRVDAAHRRAVHHRDVVVPLAQRLLDETLAHHNAMSVGVFELLQARRDQLEAELAATVAAADYHVARADLDALLAGASPSGGAPGPSHAAPTPSSPEPRGGH